MGRKLLMALLGLGAVAGFAAGFARVCHGGHGPHGRGFGRHAELERRIADTCTESAMRVYGQKSAEKRP
jgi:hypothetical protein